MGLDFVHVRLVLSQLIFLVRWIGIFEPRFLLDNVQIDYSLAPAAFRQTMLHQDHPPHRCPL